MIPELSEIIRMLLAGECTAEQAEQWIGSHIDSVSSDVMMRDQFAASAAIARDADGNLLSGSVEAVMGEARPPMDSKKEERFVWWCTAEARIRYAKADAMMEARLL